MGSRRESCPTPHTREAVERLCPGVKCRKDRNADPQAARAYRYVVVRPDGTVLAAAANPVTAWRAALAAVKKKGGASSPTAS